VEAERRVQVGLQGQAEERRRGIDDQSFLVPQPSRQPLPEVQMGIAHDDLIADFIEHFAEVWHDVKYILGTYAKRLQVTLTGDRVALLS